MNRLRLTATSRPSLPLTAPARETVTRSGEDYNANYTGASTAAVAHHGLTPVRQPSLPQVVLSRPGSPYIKAGNVSTAVGIASRTSSVPSVVSESSRRSTFKPPLPRGRAQGSILSTTRATAKSPPEKQARTEKESTEYVSRSSGTSITITRAPSAVGISGVARDEEEQLGTKPTSKRVTANPVGENVRSEQALIPAGQQKGASSTSSTSDINRKSASASGHYQSQLRRSPRKSPQKANAPLTQGEAAHRTGDGPKQHKAIKATSNGLRRSPRKLAIESAAQPGPVPAAARPTRRAKPAVTAQKTTLRPQDSASTVPSSRTPSLNELQGESLNVTGLQPDGRTLRLNEERKKQGTPGPPGTRGQAKRKANKNIDLTPHHKLQQASGLSRLGDKSDDDVETHQSQPTLLKRRTSKASPTKRQPSMSLEKRRVSRRTRADSSSESEGAPEDPAERESDEEAPMQPSSLVSLRPKRKAGAPRSNRTGMESTANSTGVDSIDESNQYERENWDSSASSSDKDGSGDTDYEEVNEASERST